jgi:hypothetical protein
MTSRWAFGLLGMLVCVGLSSCARAAAVGRRSAAGHVETAAHAVRGDVVLTPATEAGWAGWCMQLLGAERFEGCADVRSHGLVLAERWARGAANGDIRGVAVVQDNVAAVRLANGVVMPTRGESNLPEGMRAVVIEIAGGGRDASAAIIAGGFIALNSRKQRIPSSVRSRRILGHEVRSSGWQVPGVQSQGMCRLAVAGSSGFQPVRGGVAREEGSYDGLAGRALLTCASVEVVVSGGNSLLGGLLVDAANPGAPPGALPGMRLLPGHEEVYEVPGERGQILAKRVSDMWLFVSSGPFTRSGTGDAPRLKLLAALGGQLLL